MLNMTSSKLRLSCRINWSNTLNSKSKTIFLIPPNKLKKFSIASVAIIVNMIVKLQTSMISCSYLTTKKWGYPSIFKTIGIAPKSAGIRSKFLSRRFFSRRFKPPGNECGYRVAIPVPALFKSTRKGICPIPALLKALA